MQVRRMARPRVIDQDKVLDAAEAVVGRGGAARMTLDAVAAEAGISKASVIYDYKSKQNLIKAVIERKVRLEEEHIRLAVENAGPSPNAEMLGRIAVASDAPNDETRAVALNLCAALAQDADLRIDLKRFYEEQIAAVTGAAERPRMALLAFLALEGFKMLEYFGFYHWPEAERRLILEDLATLLASGETGRQTGAGKVASAA
ncbi:MAG: TetR/AcrR family transcriptional regulator [Rhizobiaceae bacterium]